MTKKQLTELNKLIEKHKQLAEENLKAAIEQSKLIKIFAEKMRKSSVVNVSVKVELDDYLSRHKS